MVLVNQVREGVVMKLAEALQNRNDLQIRIEELRKRLILNATYQEGVDPAENPKELVKELDDAITKLEWYISSINKTNSETIVDESSLTSMLAKRDALKLKRSVYASFSDAASEINQRYSRSEIKLYSSISVRDLQKKLDVMAKEIRELEMRIQETNWTTDLIE